MFRTAAVAALLAGAALTGCSAPATPVAPVAALQAPSAPASRPVATADAAATPGTAVRINGTTYIPCATEDYEGRTPCFWDAGARSNGKGQSFIWTGTRVVYTS